MARSTLGALPSTPLGALINENALTPAEHLLDYRQARFAQRVLSAPKWSDTEDIILRRGTALTERLWAAAHLGEGDDDVEAGDGTTPQTIQRTVGSTAQTQRERSASYHPHQSGGREGGSHSRAEV